MLNTLGMILNKLNSLTYWTQSIYCARMVTDLKNVLLKIYDISSVLDGSKL